MKKLIMTLVLLQNIVLFPMSPYEQGFREGQYLINNVTWKNYAPTHQPTSKERLEDFMRENHNQSLNELGGRNPEFVYSPQEVEPQVPTGYTDWQGNPAKPPRNNGGVGGFVRETINKTGKGLKKVGKGIEQTLWGKESQDTPRRVYTSEQLEQMKHSSNKQDKIIYNEHTYTPEKRTESQDAYKPFSKLALDADIAHEYTNSKFKEFIKTIYCDPEAYLALYELAANDPKIITDKSYALDDYSTMVNRRMGANMYHETQSGYETTYTDRVGVSNAELRNNTDYQKIKNDYLNYRNDYIAQSIGIFDLPDTKKTILKGVLVNYMDTALTNVNHLDKQNFGKDFENLHYILSNLSHLTDKKLQRFDPITRGILLGLADVAEDKYALAYLLSPEGKGLLGGAMEVGKALGKDAIDKVTFVVMASHYGSDEYDLGLLGVKMALSPEEFKKFRKKEAEKVGCLSRPGKKVFDAAANAGIKRTTENIIRYMVAEYINSKLTSGVTGTFKQNLKKPVTYGRLVRKVGTPGISHVGGVSALSTRTAKGILRKMTGEIIKDPLLRTSLDTLGVMKAGGLIPASESYCPEEQKK